jgi:hypothetical protein
MRKSSALSKVVGVAARSKRGCSRAFHAQGPGGSGGGGLPSSVSRGKGPSYTPVDGSNVLQYHSAQALSARLGPTQNANRARSVPTLIVAARPTHNLRRIR